MNRAARRAAMRGSNRLPGGVAFDDALHEAIRRHRAGDLHEAEALYRKLLRARPQSVDALHFLGVLRHQQGRSDEGVALLRRALALAPAHADAWSNLGNLFKESARVDDAEAAYRRALALEPNHAAAWNNVGVVLRARGEAIEAIKAFGRAIEIAPDFADAYFNLGNAFRDRRCFAEAIVAYREALSLDPRNSRAHYRLGYALYMTGAHEEAADVFRQWLAAEPGNAIAAHMLAACSGQDVPERASDDYIRTTFDGFAASFDEVLLQRLDYHAPQRLLDALIPILGAPGRVRDILDAGCGTGLCGPLLEPYARTLCGVDLSAGMLAKARARRVYDRLEEAEITAYLAARDSTFDLIASADTLCYFGELSTFARAARRALRTEGWLGFTLERSDDVETYRIQPHGRYSHARVYAQSVLAEAGFEAVHVMPVVLRQELRSDVRGWVVRARSPGAS